MSHDRMAREFVERMAYESIGNAIQPHIPICNGVTAQADTLTSSVAHRRRPYSTGDADDHECYGNHSDTDKEYDNDMMSHMRRKISNNFQHYSNLLQGLALPMLFRESKSPRESERDNEDMLDEFEFVESIELHDMEGFIFGSEREIGQGHNFLPVQLQAPTWCDKCGDFIWGVYKQCLTCSNCQYTCHHKCRPLVTLDCEHCLSSDGTERISRNHSETSLMNEKPRVDDADSGYHTGNSTLQAVAAAARSTGLDDTALSREELRCCIQAFNDNHHGLIMTLDPQSETFQGFIRVHLNLIRPINMAVSDRPPSFFEVLTHEDDAQGEVEEKEHITSFYLPKNTTKVVHICSETTTEQVIRALLAKYKITDNPRKFALYEKVEQNGKVRMQRLADDKCPLPLCLSWTAAGLDTRMFVLQENDTGEIIWEAFSLPELESFLKILDREEAEYAEQVKAKYHLLKLQMTQRLKHLNKECSTDDKRQPVFV